MGEQKKKSIAPLPAYRVFVSSTYTDMLRYREAIRDALNKADCLAYGMERFGATTIPPLDTCFEELKACQVYICALGMRYGSIDEQTQKSYTQLEYERAEALGIPILAFLVDEDSVQFNVKDIDIGDSASKLINFKERIKNSKTVTCDFFASPSDLEGKVFQAVVKEIQRQRGNQIGGEDSLNAYIEGAKIFRKFVRRPERYKNQEAILRVRFDGQYGGWRLRDEVYRAFGFEAGVAVFLNDLYTLGTNVDIDETVWMLDCFADGEAADWLDDNEVTSGTIFEGKFRFAYEMVKDGAGTVRTNYAVDAKIANLILLEGLRVISRDVSVARTSKSNSQDILKQVIRELSGKIIDNPCNDENGD